MGRGADPARERRPGLLRSAGVSGSRFLSAQDAVEVCDLKADGYDTEVTLSMCRPPEGLLSEQPQPERPSRDELDRQVRDHYGTWRDQPRGLACAIVAAFLVLTTIAFALPVLVIVMAAR